MAVKKQTRDEEDLDIHLVRELSVLKNVSHRNLMNYIGAQNEVSTDPTIPNALYIITEYCQVISNNNKNTSLLMYLILMFEMTYQY